MRIAVEVLIYSSEVYDSKLTLGSNGRVELHEPISASSTNLTVPGAIRYPTLVDASRALVVRTQTLVCA
jgi:hypothetical protein